MNGRERFLKALSLEQPDCVPTYVHAMNTASIISIGRHFTDGLPQDKPINRFTPPELLKVADTLMLIHEELDIDGITAVPLEQEEDIDDKRFRNEWGIVKERSPHGLPVPVGHPIKSAADLAAYEPPHPTERSGLVARLQQARFQGAKAQLLMVRGVFTNSWYLHGMQQLLVSFIRSPELVHGLLRLATDYCKELIALGAELGIVAIIVDDDLADKNHPLISPKHYQAMVAPYHSELVDFAHELGLKAVLHTDGNVWPLIPHFIAAGFDGLNPLEPDAGMDLGRVKAEFGDRLCLLGNIDCGELLCHGSAAEVEAAVVAAIDAAKAGGGYILCDSNSIHPGVKPENFIAMMRAAKRYGSYS